MKATTITRSLLLAATLLWAGACDRVDDQRLPWADVHVGFTNIGQWEAYGVTGACQHRRFIRADRVPADYPYTAMTYTGFGGILLVSDVMGNPLAYDLACPVEVLYNVRVAINDDNLAECPRCHSTYDVFVNYGSPISGPAYERGYALTRYKVGPGMAGEYMMIYR